MNIKEWLQSLSFRTGVIVLMCCIPFYILSFAQMLLPISTTAKGILWAVLFGLAKTCQYGGLTILGVEGYKRLRNKFKKHLILPREILWVIEHIRTQILVQGADGLHILIGE